MSYTYETKKELRQDVRSKTIREISVRGALGDAREIELHWEGGGTLTIETTTWGTLRVIG